MTRRSIAFAVLAALAPALPGWAQTDEQAKRRHVLPHVADGGGWQSSVLVTNVAQSFAFCTLELKGLGVDRFHEVDGVTATGSRAAFELEGHGGNLVWKSRNDGALASGYVVLDCNAPVVAQVVFAWIGGGGRPEGIATVFSSQEGREFQLPVLTPDGTLGFAVANDTAAEAECGVVLRDPRRTKLGEAAMTVPAQTSRARMLDRIVALPADFAGGSATVSCDRQVSMMGLHFELRSDGSIVTFNTLPPAVIETFFLSDEQAKRRHVLPHLADGDGWQSSLVVTNVGGSVNRCALELFGLTPDRFEEVEGVTASGSGAEFELGRGGGYRVWPTRNESSLASGYATLDCVSPALAQVVFAWIGEGDRPSGLATIFSSQESRAFQFPVLTAAGTVGFAVANDTPDVAECRIVLEDPDWAELGESNISVPSRTSRTQMLRASVAIPEDFRGGTARIGCDQAVAVIGLHFELEPDGAIVTFNTLLPAVVDASLLDGGGPRPTVTLSASPIVIEEGQTTTLRWSSTGAESATIVPAPGDVATSGSLDVAPRVTTTYRVTVANAVGRRATESVTVTVNTTDRDALTAFYEAAGGDDWRRNGNWLSDRPLAEWDGVGVNAAWRVGALHLGYNNLTGSIPPELGELAELVVLDLRGNDLTGTLPSSIGRMTRLTTLNLGFNDLAGSIPPELGELAELEVLDLGHNDLTGPIPASLGRMTRLRRLDLGGNHLTGSIPPELGELAALEVLDLGFNRLTGPMPASLGRLTRLEALRLGYMNLTGAIPPELGRLTRLSEVTLNHNALTGPIPPELGRLTRLSELRLHHNALTGPIPPELGLLTRLPALRLNHNALTGPIPPELGQLRELTRLDLSHNALTGPVPRELTGMARLSNLFLTNNAGISGPLPRELAGLDRLERLMAAGTDLCAPPDPRVQGWLDGLLAYRVAVCGHEDTRVYLTQAVQSREYPVPLVAGEEALLRVFVTAEDAGGATMPPARARFYLEGEETYVADIAGGTAPIPAEVMEGSLDASVNALVPADVVQPGLEIVVEIDPDRTVEPAVRLARRFPETGRVKVDVRAMPVFDLTLIPFIVQDKPDESIVDTVQAMASDPEGHELFWGTRNLMPVAELAVTAHAPVTVDTDSIVRLLARTEMMRTMEGGSGYYMGTVAAGVVRPALGIANIGGRDSVSIPDSWVIAHELGHNLGLNHAPCVRTGIVIIVAEAPYPHRDGSIGAWGYDFRDGGRLVSPATPDLMSYCRDNWVGDYHFASALRYRLRTEGDAAASTTATAAVSESAGAGTSRSGVPVRSLLLWGGVDTGGAPFLEPAFVVDAPASLPAATGDYRLVGTTADGRDLFSLPFAMPETADGGGSSFAFAVPVQAGWGQALAGVTLAGPGGSATLDAATDRPVRVLRDPATGQVRGVLRDPPTVADPAVEVVISRGLPEPEAWR